MERIEPRWTLDELTARVALALSVDYAGQSSGRVREVPDRRTIRFYTTLGLLDRPAALRGRTALYSTRHLMQIVAIKRLQAEGCPLREVQAHLLGISDARLRELARVPEPDLELGEAEDLPREAEEGGPDRRATAFWANRGESFVGPESRVQSPEPEREHPSGSGLSTGERGASAPCALDSGLRWTLDSRLSGVPLAEGVTLLLDLTRVAKTHTLQNLPLDEQDVQAIQAAAAPLLQVLRARRLLQE